MYFPFLRGKQFELLALKELAPPLGDAKSVHPIVEPVREPAGGLARSLGELESRGVPYTLVLNPSVGDLAKRPTATLELVTWAAAHVLGYRGLDFGLIVGSYFNPTETTRFLSEAGFAGTGVTLIHDDYFGDKPQLIEFASKTRIERHLVADKSDTRRYGDLFRGQPLVVVSDGFQSKETNVQYLDNPVTFFSDKHLYYKDDGYVGFSDFLTIGRKYAEGGSLPRAVIIHWTYLNPDDQMLYVRHFASDTNEDTSDTAGKFLEAATKLVAFAAANRLENPAVSAMNVYVEGQTFPGLGTIKKLSIENHLYVLMALLAA